MFTGHGLSGQIQEALPIKNNPLSLVTENHFCANTVYVFVCVPLHFIFIVLHFLQLSGLDLFDEEWTKNGEFLTYY